MKSKMRDVAWGYLYGHGYTVLEIANEFGLSRQAVNNALNGLPDIEEFRVKHNVSKAQREFDAFREKQRVSE